MKLKQIPKMTQKKAIQVLRLNHNIKISVSSLSKIWKGIY